MYEFLLAVSPLLSIVALIAVVFFVVFYISTIESLQEKSSNNKTKNFINSLQDIDEIFVTLADSNEYRTYIYAKIKDKYLNFEYSKLSLNTYPQSLSLEEFKKLVNYLYTVTDKNFTIVDLTTRTEESVEFIDNLHKVKKPDIIEGSVEKLDAYESNELTGLNKLN